MFSILTQAVLDDELIQMVGLSQLEQVFTRLLSKAQIDAVSVEPKFDYTVLLLLVLNVS